MRPFVLLLALLAAGPALAQGAPAPPASPETRRAADPIPAPEARRPAEAPAAGASDARRGLDAANERSRDEIDRKYRDWDRRASRAVGNICSGCGVGEKRARPKAPLR